MRNWEVVDGSPYCCIKEDFLDAAQDSDKLGINLVQMNFNYGNKVSICSDSSLTKKGFPTIFNNLKYANYDIKFKTLIRPKLKVRLKKPKEKILKQVKKRRHTFSIFDTVFCISITGRIVSRLFRSSFSRFFKSIYV